jgi:peptidoglycan/LPS O-acetylase OafA/YrhL
VIAMGASERSIPTLDGWRAVAISLVLFSHGYPSIQRTMGLPEVYFREPLGLLGVEVFFALSGFLITTRLLQEEERHGSISLANFYTRRALRILPAALLFTLSIALMSAVGLLPFISQSRTLSTIFFFANYSTAEPSYYLGHFWSLAVEEHFYFVWPALLAFCGKRHRLRVAIASAILIALWRAITWKFQISTSDPAKYFGRTDIVADSIMWGAALALAVQSQRVKRSLSIVCRPLIWTTLAILPIVAVLHVFGDWKINLALFSLCRVTVPLMIFGTVINLSGAIALLLNLESIRYVGRISYSLYLWQELFLIIPNDQLAHGPLTVLQLFPINFIGAFACAIISYHAVEQPLIEFGKSATRVRVAPERVA